RIAPSSLVGIGAKLAGTGWIVGTAQASLDASTKGAIKTTITENTGAKQTVYLASIPVLVKVTYYNATGAAQSSWVPSAIQNAADSLAHKHVSPAALVHSTLLLFMGIIL